MKRFISIIVLFVIIISGCRLSTSPKADEETGSIYINLGSNDIENRTIVPDIIMEIASYDIVLNGPNSELIQVTGITEAFYFQSGLAIGAWTVIVDAKNADGVIIARDSQAFSILIGNTTPVSIVVTPLTGNGTLNVNISWPAGNISTPGFSAQLVSLTGASSDLSFTVGATSGTYASSTIAAGYYELLINAYDDPDPNPVWGIADVVRIVEGEITTASWTILSDSVGSVGSVEVTITSDLQNPIPLSLNGTIDSLNLGEDMTVAVSPSGLDSYKWYVNGQVQGATTSSIAVGSSLSAGNYSLTSIIRSGSVLSSESVTFSVNDWAESQLLASDAGAGDYFGYSTAVSSDGSTIIVSAAHDDDGIEENTGSVYVYKWSGSAWAGTKLSASNGVAGDYYGESVSVSSDGSRFVVGSLNNSLYLYEWNGAVWTEYPMTETTSTSISFGRSVSISSDGNTIVSGAALDSSTGALYVIKWNGSDWVQTKLSASDGASSDGFGVSVSVSSDGNTVLAGTLFSEAIYIYKWNGSSWDETILTASDGSPGDYFGSSVSLSDDGNTLVSGANGDDSAYVFRWNGSAWIETKLTPSDVTVGDNFGFSVAVSPDGNTVVVGADQQNLVAGAVYTYEWNGVSWKEIKMTAADGAAGDNFGNSVDVSAGGSKILAGAYQYDTASVIDSGSLYVFEK